MAEERSAAIGRYPVKEMGMEIEVEHYDSEDQRTTYVYLTVDELNGMHDFMTPGKRCMLCGFDITAAEKKSMTERGRQWAQSFELFDDVWVCGACFGTIKERD